jgi:hypothetical protein
MKFSLIKKFKIVVLNELNVEEFLMLNPYFYKNKKMCKRIEIRGPLDLDKYNYLLARISKNVCVQEVLCEKAGIEGDDFIMKLLLENKNLNIDIRNKIEEEYIWGERIPGFIVALK